MKPLLSKSQFIRGLQCVKSLWLYRNHPELRTPPDEARQAAFDMGTDVGLLARGLFPGGMEIIFESGSSEKKAQETEALIKNGTETIYEATFIFDDIVVMVDILHKGKDGWEIYEVKNSTGVKDVHLNDLSVQYHVLRGAGLDISRASIVHINNEYVRCGALDVSRLFDIAELTEDVKENQTFVKAELERIKMSLGPERPDIAIGPHCKTPYECDFHDVCWADVNELSDADGATIFSLRGHGIDKFDYHRRGIIRLSDIRLVELNKKQRMQVETHLTGDTVIDREEIMEFLQTLHYPMYFLDFETFMPVVPLFEGTRPYERIPFQYSIDLIEKEGAEPRHFAFLATPGVDEREKLAEGLVSTIPKDACTVAYNATFEKGVIADLAEKYPFHSEKLMRMRSNIRDLMLPFKHRHYYTKEMKGSYSLKFVLPALVPDLSYKSLEIKNAGEAELAYSTLHLVEDKNEVERIQNALHEYCGLDTFAMVRLVEKLKAVLKDAKG